MKRYFPERKFVIKPSKLLGMLLVCSHFGAVICILPLLIFWPLKILLSILCGINLLILLRKCVFLSAKNSVIQVRFFEDQWFLTLQNKIEITSECVGASFSSNFFVLLLFQIKKKKMAVVIFKDGIEVEEFRRLKVLLKCQK